MSEFSEMMAKDPQMGPWAYLPWDIEREDIQYTEEELNDIRTYKGLTDSYTKLFGEINDENARIWSGKKDVTAKWFDEPIPQASDITNLMEVEMYCSIAIDEWQKENS